MRFTAQAAAALLVLAVCGCLDSGDQKPMDEPLGPGDAMRADEEMRGRARELVHERAPRDTAPAIRETADE